MISSDTNLSGTSVVEIHASGEENLPLDSKNEFGLEDYDVPARDLSSSEDVTDTT